MKFTAVVPVMKYETKTYDVNASENLLRAYEKWYDNMSDENQQALINAIKREDPDFNPERQDFENYMSDALSEIKWQIYKEESYSNEAVYEVEDIHNLADGDFTFLD